MKNKRSNSQNQRIIRQAIINWYFLLIEDYPKNRDFVFSIFDAGLKLAQNPRMESFWRGVMSDFKEVEASIEN